MKLQADFVSSAFRLSDCPSWDLGEVAIAGRSNVGKSSMLNALAERRELARTSKTPGRTRCLNFFDTGKGFALVDLPGYGYAKIPRSVADTITKMMREYLTRRDNLVSLVLLVDSRRGPGLQDLELARLIKQRGVDLIAVATKIDKLSNSERREALKRFRELGVEPVVSSAAAGLGIAELRRRIVASVESSRKGGTEGAIRAFDQR